MRLFPPRVVLGNVRCGLHSGLPWCCIAWYVTVWTTVAWYHPVFENWGDGRGYVPCPICRDKGPESVVEVLQCDCELDDDDPESIESAIEIFEIIIDRWRKRFDRTERL
jgi:hypothetical protein